MYSLMSMRIIAFSSSKRNSASARDSSVFPTPVGPRKMNEPIGRFSSCNPARARRTAFETATIASCWPTTRCRKRSSIFTSFSRSPSCNRETGMCVQLETTSRDVFLRDLFPRNNRLPPSSDCFSISCETIAAFLNPLLDLLQLSFQLGHAAVLQSRSPSPVRRDVAPVRVPCAPGRVPSSIFRCSSMTAFLLLPFSFQRGRFFLQLGEFSLQFLRAAPCSPRPFPSSAPAAPSPTA